jgi:hypothetical protein
VSPCVLSRPDPIEDAAVLAPVKAKPCGGRKLRPALTAPGRGSCEMGGRGGRMPAARSNKRMHLQEPTKNCLSISSVVRTLRHWLGGRRVKVNKRSPAFSRVPVLVDRAALDRHAVPD